MSEFKFKYSSFQEYEKTIKMDFDFEEIFLTDKLAIKLQNYDLNILYFIKKYKSSYNETRFNIIIADLNKRILTQKGPYSGSFPIKCDIKEQLKYKYREDCCITIEKVDYDLELQNLLKNMKIID